MIRLVDRVYILRESCLKYLKPGIAPFGLHKIANCGEKKGSIEKGFGKANK